MFQTNHKSKIACIKKSIETFKNCMTFIFLLENLLQEKNVPWEKICLLIENLD